MIDYETFAVADGRAAKKDLTLCCLLNEDLTDSFAVSENLCNQAFTVQSSNPVNSEDKTCGISAQEVARGAHFSIQSKLKTERNYCVKGSQSAFYAIWNTVSDLFAITINVISGVAAGVCRHIRRTFNNMKGRRNRGMFCTLRLLRL